MNPLVDIVSRIEGAEVLDTVTAPVGRLASRLVGSGRLRSLLSGTAIGHSLHPVLVAVPVGAWSGAGWLDLRGREPAAARSLIALGLAVAVPAAATGLSDWADTEDAEKRVGMVHAGLNTVAISCYVASWRARAHGGGRAWSLAGALVMGMSGYLGGHLAYGQGVGVDANAFETGPGDWSLLPTALPAPGELARMDVDGIRLVVAQIDGRPAVLADRCSHRGGPLSDGDIVDGCVRCPWHDSLFDLQTGEARQGPAAIPQPVYESRPAGSGWEVRRVEPRALRRNSVRVGRG